MTSAAEAEAAGVFGNGQEMIAIRILFKALGHPQLATLAAQDGQLHIAQFRTCQYQATPFQDLGHAMELALSDKATYQRLRMYWAKGTDNDADYFMKHHPPSHHLPMRPKYVLNAHQGHSVKFLFSLQNIE